MLRFAQGEQSPSANRTSASAGPTRKSRNVSTVSRPLPIRTTVGIGGTDRDQHLRSQEPPGIASGIHFKPCKSAWKPRPACVLLLHDFRPNLGHLRKAAQSCGCERPEPANGPPFRANYNRDSLQHTHIAVPEPDPPLSRYYEVPTVGGLSFSLPCEQIGCRLSPARLCSPSDQASFSRTFGKWSRDGR